MPAYIVKQPNGLYARFSTIVDSFTHYGMTVEEAYEVCHRDMGIDDAKAKVQRGVEDDMTGFSLAVARLPDGLNRWRDALHTIAICLGEKALDEAVKEILG